VRYSVRKLTGVAMVGALGALFAVPMLSAGAQEVPTDPVQPDCTILSVTPNPVVAPGSVTVTGVGESGVTVTLYGQSPPGTGPTVPLASQVVGADNGFVLQGNITEATDISANFTFGDGNAYTGGCATPEGEVVVRANVTVSPGNVTKPAAAAQSLAFTGSNDTPSYVLIGLAALVLGAVLVIAAKRRQPRS
jgi:LPXTG-motif cell wall-anchored protein